MAIDANKLIEEGIAEGSIEKIVKGYNKLAGKKIRVKKPKKTNPRDDLIPAESVSEGRDEAPKDKFFVDNGSPRRKNEKGQVEARRGPWQPPTRNNFKDDKKLEKQDIKESKRLSKNAVEKDYRKPFKEVPVKCVKCEKTNNVHPSLVPRPIDGEEPNYVCDRCIRNNVKKD